MNLQIPQELCGRYCIWEVYYFNKAYLDTFSGVICGITFRFNINVKKVVSIQNAWEYSNSKFLSQSRTKDPYYITLNNFDNYITLTDLTKSVGIFMKLEKLFLKFVGKVLVMFLMVDKGGLFSSCLSIIFWEAVNPGKFILSSFQRFLLLPPWLTWKRQWDTWPLHCGSGFILYNDCKTWWGTHCVLYTHE